MRFCIRNWSAMSDEAPRDNAGKPLSFLNVGTGIDLSIRELAEQVADTIGYKGTIKWDHSKPDGTPKKQLDISRLEAMGWRAKISLREGLARTVADFRQSKRHRGIEN